MIFYFLTIKFCFMKSLSLNQMTDIQGGNDTVVDIINGACALGGAAAVLGAAVAPGALAFCAGWTLGQWLWP